MVEETREHRELKTYHSLLKVTDRFITLYKVHLGDDTGCLL